MAKAGRKKKAKVPSLAPGYDGQRRVVMVDVQQPYGPKGATEMVARNARHDPIEQLYHQTTRSGRKGIDEAQYQAALRLRMLVETVGMGKLRSMSLDMDRVDGGAAVRDIGLEEIKAAITLKQIKAILGCLPYMVLVRVAGYGEAIASVAIDLEENTVTREGQASNKSTRDGVGSTLRWALTQAAIFFGFQNDVRKDRGWRHLVGWMAEDALVREDVGDGGEADH